DILIDAFILLKKKKEFSDVKLILTGGSSGDDKKYLSDIKHRLREHGLHHQVEIHEDFEELGLREYFKKVSMVSVPVRNGEAFGLYLLECMASGVPVVQPALGAFPEIVELTGGGIIYKENTPEVLAQSLERLLSDQEELDRLSRKGKEGVNQHFRIDMQAERMVAIYEKAIGKEVPELVSK
ncbi:MAG: glycosyltransferase, partial [Bacteroidia bacterium]